MRIGFFDPNKADRYAMKWEVAALGGEFPLSMSDFKPGDIILGSIDDKDCHYSR